MALIQIDVEKAAKIVADRVSSLLEESEKRLISAGQDAEQRALAAGQQVAEKAIADGIAAFRAEMQAWRDEFFAFLAEYDLGFRRRPVGPVQPKG